MKKIFLLLFLFVTIYTIDAQTFSNPISDLADPHIVHHDGFYYCTGTTGWSVGIKKSATLEGLKSAPVYHVYDQGLGGPCCDYWAPEIHRINGNWYIYFTAAESDGGPQYSFVLENMDDDILSVNWVEKGRIYDPENDVWAIDGTVFNLDGINYFVYSAVANASDGDKPQRIYIGELTDPWTMKPGRELLSSPQYSWELNGMVNEAPEVIQRNGKVFIVYSANGCWTTDYLLGMLSLDATDDPMVASNWHKHRDPVFTKNAAVQVYGPGHHCFFTSPDGTEDWFAYHATAVPEGACDNSRTVRAQRLSWDKDGNPFFGIPVATGAKMAAPSGEPPLPAADVIENGIYQIVSKASGKLLDVAGVSQHLGANVHQWEFANVPSQRWIIQALPDGNYTINSCSGGLSMDVAGGSSEDGANIGMWAPNGTDAQMWRIEKNNEGFYSIISKNSNKAIGVENSSADNGGNIIQMTQTWAENQQFSFELATPGIEPPSGSVAWESSNYRGKFIRHADNRAQIDDFISNVEDAYWNVVPGLAGEGVSLQSVNSTNKYLRHRNGEVWLDEFADNVTFKEDATFYKEEGLAHPDMVSFRSYNMTDHYIRHVNNLLFIETISDEIGRYDATFREIDPDSPNSLIPVDEDGNNGVVLHPNPASDIVYIEGEVDIDSCILYDASGRFIGYLKPSDGSIDISGYKKGLYYVEIIFGNKSTVKKIVKE